MIRLIKRYESRKLYDTEESRYVSLEDIGVMIRRGQEVRVVENQSSEDVTAQMLTQLILEEGKAGASFPSTELLHDLVRKSGQAISDRFDRVQAGVDRLVQGSFDKIKPIREAREEMDLLRDRLEQLEATLSDLEMPGAAVRRKSATPKKATGRKKASTKKVTEKPATKAAAKSATKSPTKSANRTKATTKKSENKSRKRAG